MTDSTGHPPAGWYPDGQGAHRWWDGSGWTEHTGGAPGAPAPGVPAGPTGPPPSQPPPGQSFGWQQAGAGTPGWAGYGEYPGGRPVGPPGPSKRGPSGLLIGGIVGAVVLVVALVVVLAVTLGGGDSEQDAVAGAAASQEVTDSASAKESEPSGEPTEEGTDDGGDSGDASSEDPAAVAEEYLQAQLDADPVRVCELSSAEKREAFTVGSPDDGCDSLDTGEAESPSEAPDDFGVDFLTDVTQQDDTTATVEYDIDVTGDGTPGAAIDDPFGRLSMVVEDGQWRVDDEEFIG